MVTPELVTYIWTERKKGTTEYIIKMGLFAQGWTEQDFAEAVATLPPAHSDKETMSPNMIAGSDLRALGQQTVWRTPDGKMDLPAVPVARRYGITVKKVVFLILGIFACVAAYIYRDVMGPALYYYYDVSRPVAAQIIQIIRMSTDFSH